MRTVIFFWIFSRFSFRNISREILSILRIFLFRNFSKYFIRKFREKNCESSRNFSKDSFGYSFRGISSNASKDSFSISDIHCYYYYYFNIEIVSPGLVHLFLNISLGFSLEFFRFFSGFFRWFVHGYLTGFFYRDFTRDTFIDSCW